MVNVSLENQGGIFFMKTPLTQLGITKNFKNKVEFLVKNLLFMSVFGNDKL